MADKEEHELIVLAAAQIAGVFIAAAVGKAAVTDESVVKRSVEIARKIYEAAKPPKGPPMKINKELLDTPSRRS